MRKAHLALILLACLNGVPLAGQSMRVDFGRDVQPILRENCYGCHGPSQQIRGIRVDQRRSLMPNRVGANGARIIPGNSETSRLFTILTGQLGGLQMPPAGPLSPAQIQTIRTWIDQGADWPDELSGEVEPPAPDPQAAQIMEALRKGDRQSALRLLREHPEAVNRFGPGGQTPLMYAVLYGDAGTVRLLLDRGADPNVVSASKVSALMYAVDDPEKIRLLLDRGADPNARSDDGQTPLLIAVTLPGNSFGVAKSLLDRGANIKTTSLTGGTVLNAAASSGDPRLLELLLERGAEKTPLPLAAAVQSGCRRCIDVLIGLAGPADLASALTAAVRMGDDATTRMLLDRGARADANLATTLALIPQLPPLDLVRTLLDRGTDIHATTRLGVTVLDLAKRQGETKLVEILVIAGARSSEAGRPEVKASPASSIRQAIERSIPPLQRADEAFLRKAACVSCHNNSLAPLAMSSARKSKLPVNEEISRGQLKQVAAFLASNGERALQGLGIPGGVDTVGYVLLGMAAENYPADVTTDIWARFLKNRQETDGRWVMRTLRPPIEASSLQVTATALRALQIYAPPSKREEYQKSIRLAARWIEAAEPKTTEDRVFQILGLQWSGAKKEIIRKAADALIAEQRPDGGWGQLPTLASDAYATGQTLFALTESDVLGTASTAYRKGIQFLLNTQLADGSWYVQTRTLPSQRYFDSEFPHGADQFISTAATNWAVMALAPAVR